MCYLYMFFMINGLRKDLTVEQNKRRDEYAQILKNSRNLNPTPMKWKCCFLMLYPKTNPGPHSSLLMILINAHL
jgi:hypothetical protein